MDLHNFWKLDPDPHQIEKLDPDPHQRDADPQHSFWVYRYLLFVKVESKI
jgi:hypothetical protein